MAEKTNDPSQVTETITVTGKPSGYKATDYYDYKKTYTKTWKNWCPQCGRVGCLSDNPKGTGEGEITCDKSKGGCDADYDLCTGGDKQSPPRAYLMDANGRQNSNGNIDTAVGGSGDGTQQAPTATTDGSGTAINIEDKTFYGLIKQIIGVTDATFTIANNMAYLLTFKDLHKYKEKYQEHIHKIKGNQIIKDSIIQNWTPQGMYNSIEVTYKDGIIKFSHEVLVKMYGEHVFYYTFKEDDEETAIAKAKALLNAHVRDYSLDLQFNCIYNPNITVGSWVKIPKKLTKTTKELYKEQEEPITAKRKGVDITNITETVQSEEHGTQTVIQKITTSDKKEYEIKTEKDDYDIYYVHSYSLRWAAERAPIMHVHVKYGPDTPEAPINATVGIGGQSTTGGGGGFGDDCFWIGEIMPNNNARIGPHDGAPDLHKAGFEPTDEHKKARCKQGSNLANDVAGMTPEEAFGHVVSRFGYCLYADSSELWPCVSDMYDQAAGCGLNCADHTRVMKCVFDAIGIPCWGVHVVGHYYNAIDLDGEWRCVDATSSYSWSNISEWARPSSPAKCCQPGQASKTRSM